MASEQKTQALEADVRQYLCAVQPASRQEDALQLLDLFSQETGLPATLWTGGIIGFGRYRYCYPSGHAGEAAITGFALRKDAISLYTWLDEPLRGQILTRLGKHRSGVGCVYIKRLSDVDPGVLRELIRAAVQGIKAHHAQYVQP
ncbi:MAG: DUF1801 domain-containing protein [Christensenellales bacterium]